MRTARDRAIILGSGTLVGAAAAPLMLTTRRRGHHVYTIEK